MIIKNNIYLILASFFLIGGCKKENALDCFKSNGAETTELRLVQPFSVVKLYNKIDLYINKGADFKVEVKAGKNIISNIKTTVVEGILTIDNYNKCNFVRGYKQKINVFITVPYLKQSENRGVGTITFNEGFTQDTIKVVGGNAGDTYLNGTFNEIRTSSHGNGDIYINGVCNNLFVYAFGTNILNAENLKINNYVFVENVSIGNCYINTPFGGTLEYNIWQSGNIYYQGNPSQITNYSNGKGKGQLIKKN